ncbi:hypothetical protein TVAGG3_0279240, partial [Trichomonas vaginalis G3]
SHCTNTRSIHSYRRKGNKSNVIRRILQRQS